MKVLLIDDQAHKGWKQLIENVFPVVDLKLEVALDINDAKKALETSYDFIFLDLRLTPDDFNVYETSELSSFRLLQQIKSDFKHVNFATPVLVFTASNKIWHINKFLQNGADAFYIKEHPDYTFNKELSKFKFETFKTDFIKLTVLGNKRKEIWNLSNTIIKSLEGHNYFNGDKIYENVRNRIIDKLKLGYVYLFKNESEQEKDVLLQSNESLSYIIYFSILEEVVKGFTDKSSWTEPAFERSTNWKFRNREYLVEDSFEYLTVNFKRENSIKNDSVEFPISDSNYKKYHSDNIINLSDQVYGLLSAYCTDEQFNTLKEKFKELNKFRNKIDFIHSEVKNVYTKELIREEELEAAYKQTVSCLEFYIKLLELKVT